MKLVLGEKEVVRREEPLRWRVKEMRMQRASLGLP